jgi:hypothetical protein
MRYRYTRRAVTTTLGLGAVTALAGCLGGSSDSAGAPTGVDATPRPRRAPPAAERPLHLAYDRSRLREDVVSGGVPKDGIPAVDDPKFVDVAAADLRDDDVVFGIVRGGTATAYPQPILVHHEIVNDRLDGVPVSVTYCPLTGTAMGFERGDTTFGVSGNLVNSNLVMYDRATDSRWPQVLATAISGPLEGRSLREFDLVWTTWKRWRGRHPTTRVLSEDTGYVRNYGVDPYGSYGPPRGYYARDSTMFPPLTADDRLGAKTVVVGVRTDRGAAAVARPHLRRHGLVAVSVADDRTLLVHDADLDAAYGYRLPADATVSTAADGVVVDGTLHSPDALPFERRPAVEAMWFAWAGFYPGTAVHA